MIVKAVTAAVCLLLAGCASTPAPPAPVVPPTTTQATSAPPVLPLLRLDAAGKPNGPIASADTGQRPTASFGPEPLRYQAGRITLAPAGSGRVAGYVEWSLPSRVTSVGASVSWPAGSGAAFVIVLPSRPWTSMGNLPPAGLHLVVLGDRWRCVEWAPGDKPYTPDAGGTFADVRDGHPRSVRLSVSGDSAEVTLPDGSVRSFTAPPIGAETSRWVVFELFELNPSTVPASITRLWAG